MNNRGTVALSIVRLDGAVGATVVAVNFDEILAFAGQTHVRGLVDHEYESTKEFDIPLVKMGRIRSHLWCSQMFVCHASRSTSEAIVDLTQKNSETMVLEQARQFRTTHWSVVLAAGQLTAVGAKEALEKLCTAYWYPLYAWLRCHGHNLHDAQDLTQAFLVHLLDKDRLQKPTPDRGRFRSFLLTSLKNFVANEWDKTQALKRGAQFTFISVDEEIGEGRFRVEPSHNATPDKAFEQSWAMTLLESVLVQLKKEYARAEKSELFEALQGYLSGDKGAVPYAKMAARLNLTEAALKMSVLRLRRRFGELLRAEIAHTLTRPEEIDEEIRALFAAVNA